uniref:Putative conserved secreted protein n=1 Tax=Anopheles darlingi TaxID=43151 RepID=A0A2M4CIG2_ANODA
MRLLALLVVTVLTIGDASFGSPILDWPKKDGDSLLGKVSNIKNAVYERKREFLNGVNERVSKLLWIPPLSSTTTESVPVVAPTEATAEQQPSLWWWQTTPKPLATSTAPSVIGSSSEAPLVVLQDDTDRLVFTVADTDELELPNVSMYARSSFIPEDQRLTDSIEFVEPLITHGRGPPVQPPTTPRHRTDRLIVF